MAKSRVKGGGVKKGVKRVRRMGMNSGKVLAQLKAKKRGT